MLITPRIHKAKKKEDEEKKRKEERQAVQEQIRRAKEEQKRQETKAASIPRPSLGPSSVSTDCRLPSVRGIPQYDSDHTSHAQEEDFLQRQQELLQRQQFKASVFL